VSTINRVFVDIDTQVDFLDPAGKLYVPGGKEIHGTLERLIAFAARSRIPVLSSADEHAPDDPEFERFGPHCVRGTPGQKKLAITTLPRSVTVRPDDELPEGAAPLLAEYDQIIFCTTTLDIFNNPHFAALADELDVGEYVVFGVATDYCVFEAARGLLETGRRVSVVNDAIRAIGEESEAEARRVLSFLGVRWVQTADVLGDDG